MILTFKNKPLEKLFREERGKGIPEELKRKIRIRLEVIDAAVNMGDIRLPGYDLHELKGDRQGTYAVKVSANWRITFKFEGGDAYDVDLEDYH
jgi:toxin HigB-1